MAKIMFLSPYQSLNFEQQLQEAALFPHIFSLRKPESHKGTYGTLAIIGGAEGMSGSVMMAATAAIYNGCGKVWIGFNQPSLPLPVVPERPEIMLSTAQNLLQHNDINAWVCGCGLGLSDSSAITLNKQLDATQNMPLLLDADALTLIAQHTSLAQAVANRRVPIILTPHPSEAARLLNCTTADIQNDRENAVLTLAKKFNATAVLKGHYSLVASVDQPIYTNTSGNVGLATAGSGDVLSGIIGSLLAQNIPIIEAVRGGVWLHGAAADVLRDSEMGEIGMLAGEIAPAARWLKNRLTTALNK